MRDDMRKGSSMNNLSDRQRKILQFIVNFVNENEFPPTIREIGEQVGISSTSVVNYNLAKLEEGKSPGGGFAWGPAWGF